MSSIMKTSIIRLGLGLITAVLLSQCASTPQSRIQDNPQLFAQLSSRDRELVSRGAIREGMTRNGVFLAWGRPGSVAVGSSNGKNLERWTYVGQRPVNTFGMGMGFGYGGFGFGGWGPYGWGYPYWGGGPTVTYVPYTAGVVEFTSGRVSRWMASPR